MRGKRRLYSLTVLLIVLSMLFCSACTTTEEKSSLLDPEDPVTITVWHYYNGAQQQSFQELVDDFNETEGTELGIIVKASGLGTVNDLEDNVLDAVNGKVGAKDLPNIFAAYADTAYEVDSHDMVVDLKQYLTEEEISEYIDSYIEEGDLHEEGVLKIFPTAKATEVFMLNKTDWDSFAAATGASIEDLSTWEGITRISQQYYEWTDSLTDTYDDGRAFFGRDSMANYFVVGAKQLGIDIFSRDENGDPKVDLPEEVARKLWDNYYVPYINGYFKNSGKFRSDDVKTGNILSFVGSSAGATFFPDQVTISDTETYPIDVTILECPSFEGGENYAVQQGAGMVVIKSEEKEIEASVEFLKWFTDSDRNIEFSLGSGYLPVKKEANSEEKILEQIPEESTVLRHSMETALKTVNERPLYTMTAFGGENTARGILENSLTDKAFSDRISVQELIQNGYSHEDAVLQFDTDDNFTLWYGTIMSQLQEAIENL